MTWCRGDQKVKAENAVLKISRGPAMGPAKHSEVLEPAAQGQTMRMHECANKNIIIIVLMLSVW